MDRQVGSQLPGEASQANVLDDEGINPGLRCRQDQVCGLIQLSRKHQHVEGQETLDAPPVQPLHQLWQFLTLKVGGPHAGIEGINAEVHRIGTVGDGSLIGMGAIILNGARIGKGCLVGAGSLVTEGKEFADGSMIMGSPAKAVRALSDEQRLGLLPVAQHYVDNAMRFKSGLKKLA